MAVNPEKDIQALGKTLTVEYTVRRYLAQIGSEENMSKWGTPWVDWSSTAWNEIKESIIFSFSPFQATTVEFYLLVHF